MTTKAKAEERPAQKPAEPAVTAKPAEEAPAAAGRSRECVVKADFHVGPAVNGQVCSYHAMHYRPDGTPRAAR